MPLLLFVLAGIVLLFNASWFSGASLVGAILLGVGVIGFLLWVVVFGFIVSVFKDTKGPGTPRFHI